MPKINGDRLLSDLRELAQFGAYKTGVHRPTLSEEDVKSRHWLVEKMEAANLRGVIDGVGNVLGYDRKDGPRMLVGSHIESNNFAGWLDGALGVICGLEVARALAEDSNTAHMGVDVAAWMDEENHFIPFLGTRSFIGTLDPAEIDRAVERRTGQPLSEALEKAGFAGRPREAIDPSRYKGYVETHIEQGDYLDRGGLQVGVVTSIVGIWQFKIVALGEQNHAGTTRMDARKDAGAAIVRVASLVAERFPKIAAERSVWTVGRITLVPGGHSVIPGEAQLDLQIRDENADQLSKFEAELNEIVALVNGEGPCSVSLEAESRIAPCRMDPGIVRALEGAAQRHAPDKYLVMPSAAGHDGQILAARLPVSMVFAPSIGGISHHWTENTKDEDIICACQVMADGIADYLSVQT